MCGLVGVAGNLNITHGKMFRTLLLVDQLRGTDSTGIVKLGFGNLAPIISKEVGPPNNLFEKDSTIFDSKGVVRTVGRALLGHNRYSTIGESTKENAHPFQFDHIYGMHNGTLHHYSRLEGYGKHPVDSMCIFDNISKHGIEETWKSFYGHAALVWWDSKEETLNFIRNSGRPLFMATNKAKTVLMWASEAWMIEAAAASAKIELSVDKNGNVTREIDTDILYSFKVSSVNYTLKTHKEVEAATYPRPFQQGGTNYYGGWADDIWEMWDKQEKEKKEEKGKTAAEVKPAPRQVGFKGKAPEVVSNSYASNRGTTKILVPSEDRRKGRFNNGWAKYRVKADKDLKGLTFRLTGSSRVEIGQDVFYAVRGVFDGMVGGKTSYVNIFPKDYEDWQTIQETLDKSQGELRYKLEARPRLGVGTNTSQMYLIGLDSICRAGAVVTETLRKSQNQAQKTSKETPADVLEEVDTTKLVLGPSGDLITEEEFLKKLAVHGSECGMCCNPINLDDADNLAWSVTGSSVFCPECNEKETLQYIVGDVRRFKEGKAVYG